MNKINKGILICSTIFCATLQAGVVDEIFSSNFQFDSQIAFTSFEEPEVSFTTKYFESSDPCTAHDLVNFIDENNPTIVDTVGLATTELGFDASFVPENGCGGNDDALDNDWLGLTSYVGNLTDINDVPVGGFSHGLQGYQISDPDGVVIVESEEVDLTGRVNNSITLDYFIDDRSHFDDPPSAGSWESDDFLHIYVKDLTNAVDLDVVNITGGIGGAMDEAGAEYNWKSVVLMLPDNIRIKVVIEFGADSGREVAYFDNIEVRGTD